MIQGSRELSKEIIIFVSHHIDYDINEDYHFIFLRIDRILFLPSWLPKYDDFIELLDGGSRTLLFIYIYYALGGLRTIVSCRRPLSSKCSDPRLDFFATFHGFIFPSSITERGISETTLCSLLSFS